MTQKNKKEERERRMKREERQGQKGEDTENIPKNSSCIVFLPQHTIKVITLWDGRKAAQPGVRKVQVRGKNVVQKHTRANNCHSTRLY